VFCLARGVIALNFLAFSQWLKLVDLITQQQDVMGENAWDWLFSVKNWRANLHLCSVLSHLARHKVRQRHSTVKSNLSSQNTMSISGSINAFAMMESVALNESHIIVEDIDYVLVEPQNNDDMEVDDDSYDYCEDVVSMLSVDQPSSLSVCSDLPSLDPTFFGIETKEEIIPERRPRVISFGNDEDEIRTRTGKFEPAVEPLDEQMTEVEETLDSVASFDAESPEEKVSDDTEEKLSEEEERIDSIAETAMEEIKPAIMSSRLSNKKRRKKMKLMKRAAAAAAAAAALSEMTAYVPTAPTLPSSPKTRRKPKTASRAKKTSSVAVACATETMEAYRQEISNKKKGSSKFVSPL